MTQLLESKNAIIYRGGGFLGRGLARTFAREGATVFLVGRPAAPLQAVADTAAFLASDRASGITASMVNVNSGLTTH